MTPRPTAFALTGAISICADNARMTLPRIKALVYKDASLHDSTATALTNCLRDPVNGANIVGFGEPGVIFTGTGPFKRRDPERYLSLANRAHWLARLERVVRRPSHLVLCGCHTGAGEKGAELLYALAQALGVPVSAPTGYVHVDSHCDPPSLYLEPGAAWQTALPDAGRPRGRWTSRSDSLTRCRTRPAPSRRSPARQGARPLE